MGKNNFWSSQGSILGLVLSNIFLNDLFLFIENSDLSHYADDKTLYSCGNNLKEVKQTQGRDFQTVTKWFYENYVVLHSGKCHFMYLGKNTENKAYFFNPFLTNVPLTDKPGSWFLLAKCLKNTCGRVTF